LWGFLLAITFYLLVLYLNKQTTGNSDDVSNDLIAANELSQNIAKILKTSCYDCHSKQTVYPWYSNVVPVSCLAIRDVKERTQRVKISDWETIDKIDKAKLLDNIVEKLKQRKMPMPIYFITQSNAKMSDADRKAIVNWAEIFTEELFD
jgi:signal recognition particle subunit SEC65